MIRHPPRSTLFPYPPLSRSLDGVWRARLYSDRAPIDFVRILQFRDFTQLADHAALSVTTVPPLSSPVAAPAAPLPPGTAVVDRKSTRLNSSHANISYAVFCL